MMSGVIVRSYIYICAIWMSLSAGLAVAMPQYAADDEISVAVDDEELYVSRFLPAAMADNRYLVIWISPGFGNQQRAYQVARQLADAGIEVWHLDLAESLFLERSSHTLRTIDGRYVARLIEKAHARTGKTVTLLSRSYGVIPLLKGARQWQLDNGDIEHVYLAGAILFSPEMYRSIPALGLEAEYMPIATATSIPIMLYQSGNRGNRWQLPAVIERLEQGGAPVSVKVLPGVTGVFYHEDTSAAALGVLERLPGEIPRVLRMLERIPTTTDAADIEPARIDKRPLDISLQDFVADFSPPPLSLPDTENRQVSREDYRGNVTVINFWASWCGPCVEEIPALNNLRQKMAGKPFELISVNYAEDAGRVRDFMEMVKVDFPVLLDETGEISASWKVLVYPATFVIGPDGEFVYGVNGAIHWDSPEVVAGLERLLPE